jgi:hypothetical protein
MAKNSDVLGHLAESAVRNALSRLFGDDSVRQFEVTDLIGLARLVLPSPTQRNGQSTLLQLRAACALARTITLKHVVRFLHVVLIRFTAQCMKKDSKFRTALHSVRSGLSSQQITVLGKASCKTVCAYLRDTVVPYWEARQPWRRTFVERGVAFLGVFDQRNAAHPSIADLQNIAGCQISLCIWTFANPNATVVALVGNDLPAHVLEFDCRGSAVHTEEKGVLTIEYSLVEIKRYFTTELWKEALVQLQRGFQLHCAAALIVHAADDDTEEKKITVKCNGLVAVAPSARDQYGLPAAFAEKLKGGINSSTTIKVLIVPLP